MLYSWASACRFWNSRGVNRCHRLSMNNRICVPWSVFRRTAVDPMSSSASALVMSGGIWEFMFGVQCCSRPTCRFSWSQVWIDSAFVYPLVDGAFVYSFRSADGCGACSCRHSACDVWCSAVPSSGITVTAVAVPATWPAVVDHALLPYCSFIDCLLAVGAVSQSR